MRSHAASWYVFSRLPSTGASTVTKSAAAARRALIARSGYDRGGRRRAAGKAGRRAASRRRRRPPLSAASRQSAARPSTCRRRVRPARWRIRRLDLALPQSRTERSVPATRRRGPGSSSPLPSPRHAWAAVRHRTSPPPAHSPPRRLRVHSVAGAQHARLQPRAPRATRRSATFVLGTTRDVEPERRGSSASAARSRRGYLGAAQRRCTLPAASNPEAPPAAGFERGARQHADRVRRCRRRRRGRRRGPPERRVLAGVLQQPRAARVRIEVLVASRRASMLTSNRAASRGAPPALARWHAVGRSSRACSASAPGRGGATERVSTHDATAGGARREASAYAASGPCETEVVVGVEQV